MRFVLLYAALVSIPVLGVLAILQAGRNLTPPRSVRGTWRVESSLSASQAGECFAAWVGSDRPQMVVSQSGPDLEVFFQSRSDLPMSGTIRGDTITLGSDEVGELPGFQAGALRLEAVLDDRAEPRRLIGWLDSGCGPVAQFVASRLPAMEEVR